MMKLLQAIKQVDQFGVVFTLFIQGSSSRAFATILLNAAALAYFFYIIIEWFQDGISPKIIKQSVFREGGSQQNLAISPFIFNVEAYGDEQYSMYKGKSIFEISTDHYFEKDYHTKDQQHPKCAYNEKIFFWDLFKPVCVDLADPGIFFKESQTLMQNPNHREDDKFLGYYLYPCDATQSDQCLGEEDTNQLFMNGNEGRITTFEQEYDFKSKQLKTIPKDNYVPLSATFKQTIYLNLVVTRITIMRGFIIPEVETISYVSQVKMTPWLSKREKGELYVEFWVNLERMENEVTVEYPRIPELMAQVSSVLGGLMALGIVFTFLNNLMMRKSIINDLKEIFFFENKNGITPSNNLSRVSPTPGREISKKQQDDMEEQLISKCNIINLVYEVSKIQLALQTLLKRAQLIEIQKMKYTMSSQQFESEEEMLNDKDLGIFFFKQDQFINPPEQLTSQEFRIYQRVNLVILKNQRKLDLVTNAQMEQIITNNLRQDEEIQQLDEQ